MLTSLTGAAPKCGSLAAPVPPVEATTVTWWSSATRSAAFSRAASAWVTKCSPMVPLMEMTLPMVADAVRRLFIAAGPWQVHGAENSERSRGTGGRLGCSEFVAQSRWRGSRTFSAPGAIERRWMTTS